MIDVAEGDKIPRKGGPAIRHSDLLLINKTELAPYVGADLGVMARDSKLMRGERPFLFADLRIGERARTSCSRGCGARCCSCEASGLDAGHLGICVCAADAARAHASSASSRSARRSISASRISTKACSW